MNPCISEEQMISYLHGDIRQDDIEKIEQHLEECHSCKQKITEIEQIINTLGNRQRPKPEKGLLNTYHRELSIKFSPAGSAGSIKNWITRFGSAIPKINFRPVSVAYALGLIFLGILTDRFLLKPEPAVNGLTIEQTRLIASLSESDVRFMQSFFNETDFLFESIVNPETGITANQTGQLAHYARKLIQKSYQLEHYNMNSDWVLLNFLNQIELILIEICNAEDNEIQTSIHNIRDMVVQTKLLIKIKKYRMLFNEIAVNS